MSDCSPLGVLEEQAPRTCRVAASRSPRRAPGALAETYAMRQRLWQGIDPRRLAVARGQS